MILLSKCPSAALDPFWNVKGRYSGCVALSGVRGVTLRDKVRGCEILEPLLRMERYVGSAICPECSEKIGEASPAGYTHRKTAKRTSNDQVEW